MIRETHHILLPHILFLLLSLTVHVFFSYSSIPVTALKDARRREMVADAKTARLGRATRRKTAAAGPRAEVEDGSGYAAATGSGGRSRGEAEDGGDVRWATGRVARLRSEAEDGGGRATRRRWWQLSRRATGSGGRVALTWRCGRRRRLGGERRRGDGAAWPAVRWRQNTAATVHAGMTGKRRMWR